MLNDMFFMCLSLIYMSRREKAARGRLFLMLRGFFTFRIIFHASNSSCDAPRLLSSTLHFLGVSCSSSFTFHLLPLIESQAAHL